jgi:hypothetical protein
LFDEKKVEELKKDIKKQNESGLFVYTYCLVAYLFGFIHEKKNLN